VGITSEAKSRAGKTALRRVLFTIIPGFEGLVAFIKWLPAFQKR
jgi:hypothetical protein